MNFIESILDFWLKKKVIQNCEGDPYLHRWYLFRTDPFAIFIHKFVRSDWERDLHDHPWPFIVIPIWRGYVEFSELWGKLRMRDGTWVAVRAIISRRVWPLISARKRKATYKHRVQLINNKPAWSIFIRFRECRDWGFWTSKGWIKWNYWWQQNCE